MSDVGQAEKKTRKRVIKLFVDTLEYNYPGDWTDRLGQEGNGNRSIEPDLLRAYLEERKYDDNLISRALYVRIVRTHQGRDVSHVVASVIDC